MTKTFLKHKMKFNMRIFILAILGLIGLVHGGSECPEREMIYPCYCTSVPLSKKNSFTIVSCRHVAEKSSLSDIFRTLRSMTMDRFILYDSFWQVGFEGDQEKRTLPQNWMSQLKFKELEIVDTHLSEKFACDLTTAGPNNLLTKLTISNSSISDHIVSNCDGKGKIWTVGLVRLQQFHFVYNKLKKFDKTVFPLPMGHMVTMNLSHNEISVLGNSAFDLPKLAYLDLSHNMITDLPSNIFGSKETALTYLDLSNNYLTKLHPDTFRLTPFLQTVLLRDNRFSTLKENEWEKLSKEVKILDVEGNPLECGCDLIWMNCTLKVHVNIFGSCMEEDYQDMTLRKVAIYMSKVCNENGVIEPLVNKTRNACEERKTRMSNAIMFDQGNSNGPHHRAQQHVSSADAHNRRNRRKPPTQQQQ